MKIRSHVSAAPPQPLQLVADPLDTSSSALPASPFDFTLIAAALKSNARVIPAFKQTLQNSQEQLDARFRAGEDIESLIRARATLVDEVLRLAWQRFEWNENRSSWRKNRISLVAVGGYGRGELHPHSDIDLLILLERPRYGAHQQNIQSFVTMLWDIGLEVGHSTRSIKECGVQARGDVSVVTALMESRTIVGDTELQRQVAKLVNPKRIWSPRAFFEAKVSEQNARHGKSNYTEYSLEPNVKSSPGGLRDIQTVMWIAKRRFECQDFSDLVPAGFLTPEESDVLREGRRFLWKVRYALHLIAGREDDRLLFEHQKQVAELFEYEDGDQLAVEQFMQTYYRTALMVYATNELLLQHFEEAILRTGDRARVEPINERFQIRNRTIEVTSDDVFVNHPPALLELFVLLGTNPAIETVRATTARLAKNHVYLIDDTFRSDPVVTGLFIDLLRNSARLFSQLRRMERYGILGAYLPEFARVIGQMQFDLFHIYTVDAHTLQVVRNMRRFRHRNQQQRFPIAAHIHPRLPKVELLYIAGLYHDIAKGQGGDHSRLGVSVVRDFCARHHLGTWDTNLVAWLVENHLVMSTTAQRKDLSEPDVINEFAQFVQDQVRLDYLYALTVADITATNPTLWNAWRASLMHQLYTLTKRTLRHGVENHVDKADFIAETQTAALERLMEKGATRDDILREWEPISEDYFLRESVADIVWHTEGLIRHDLTKGPLILIGEYRTLRSDEGATQIFVHSAGNPNHFVATAQAFEQLSLNVVDARIVTADGDEVFNTFLVLEGNGQPVGERPARCRDITETLNAFLTGKARRSGRRRPSTAMKSFQFKTSVTLSADTTNNRTVVEVISPDRPGLLATIARVFVDLGVVLRSARITTLGERVEDMFYVTDLEGNAFHDPSFRETLVARVQLALDEAETEPPEAVSA